jgi:hypothetical protein
MAIITSDGPLSLVRLEVLHEAPTYNPALRRRGCLETQTVVFV